MAKRQEAAGYLTTLGKAAPFFLAKSVLGDLPKGGIEKAIELKLGPKKVPLRKGFMKGISGRGSGRAIGAMSGIVTAPLYLKSLSLLKSKKKSDRKKGLALLVGVTSTFTVQKGMLESIGEQGGISKAIRRRVSRLPAKASGTSLKKALGLGVGRLSYKIPSALIMAKGLTSGGGKGKGKKNKALMSAALGGAGAGALSRAGDTIIKELTAKSTSKAYKFNPGIFGKKMMAGGVGGAAAGALGGLVLSKAISAANKSLSGGKKK